MMMSRKSGTTGSRNNKFSKLYCKAILLLCFGLAALISYLFFTSNIGTEIYWKTIAITACLLIGGLLFRKARRFIESKPHAMLLILLLSLCVGVKLFWVLRFRIVPMVDYKTFYNTASALADSGSFINSRYIALFPHIFGYSYFLSFFFTIFGADTLIPPLVNVALSCISLIMIYYICNKLISKSAAFAAGLIWTLYPSQTMYNMFVLSEPLYSALILGAWTWIIALTQRHIFTKSLLHVTVSALFLAFILFAINMVRPIALIILISLFILLFILKPDVISGKKAGKNKLIFFTIVTAAYFLLTPLATHIIAASIGEKPSTVPGYSLYVGFNERSLGKYNTEDADLLFQYSNRPGWSAQDAQREMLQSLRDRILCDNLNFGRLLYRKYEHLWADDSSVVSYMKSIITDQNDANILVIACNGFYHFTIILSCASLILLFIHPPNPLLLLVPLYMIGLSMSQMLVEIAGRYHYSGILVFTILASYTIFAPSKIKESG